MQTCNPVKTTSINGIASVSSLIPRGQQAMPTTDNVASMRDDLTLVDNNHAAEIIGCNHRTLMNWRSTGKSPRYVKVGRSVRYRISDLMAWLDAQTRNHTGEVA